VNALLLAMGLCPAGLAASPAAPDPLGRETIHFSRDAIVLVVPPEMDGDTAAELTEARRIVTSLRRALLRVRQQLQDDGFDVRESRPAIFRRILPDGRQAASLHCQPRCFGLLFLSVSHPPRLVREPLSAEDILARAQELEP
jgi:hypothetical protein